MSIVLINADGSYTIPITQEAVDLGNPPESPAAESYYVFVNADGSYSTQDVPSVAVSGDVRAVAAAESECAISGDFSFTGSVASVGQPKIVNTFKHVARASGVGVPKAAISSKNVSSTTFYPDMAGVAKISSDISSGVYVSVEGCSAVARVAAVLPESVLALGAGSANLELLGGTNKAGGVFASGQVGLEFLSAGTQAFTGNAVASAAYLDFVDSAIKAFEGEVGNALIQLSAGGVGTAGSNALSHALLEFEAVQAVANVGALGSSSGLLYITANGAGYSNIVIDGENPAELDILAIPYTGFTMNMKTKGFTAYTDNVNGKIPFLVATPVSNLASKRKKHVRDLYAHMRTAEDVMVSTITDEVKSRTQTSSIEFNDDNGLHTQRAKLSRGTEGVNWQFFLEGAAATEFAVEFIEARPTISERRTS